MEGETAGSSELQMSVIKSSSLDGEGGAPREEGKAEKKMVIHADPDGKIPAGIAVAIMFVPTLYLLIVSSS